MSCVHSCKSAEDLIYKYAGVHGIDGRQDTRGNQRDADCQRQARGPRDEGTLQGLRQDLIF